MIQALITETCDSFLSRCRAVKQRQVHIHVLVTAVTQCLGGEREADLSVTPQSYSGNFVMITWLQ